MTYKAKKGRRTSSGPPFAQLHHYLLDSAAWHRLSFGSRCAYLELARLYNGINNGSLGLSVRRLADLMPCDKSVASRYLNELETEGFIEVVKTGTFSRKERHASEYRLTCYRCDLSGALPTKKFDPSKRYVPGASSPKKAQQSRYAKSGQTVRKKRTDAGDKAQSVRKLRTVEPISEPPSVRKKRTHIESYHGGSGVRADTESPSLQPYLPRSASSENFGSPVETAGRLEWSTPVLKEVHGTERAELFWQHAVLVNELREERAGAAA